MCLLFPHFVWRASMWGARCRYFRNKQQWGQLWQVFFSFLFFPARQKDEDPSHLPNNATCNDLALGDSPWISPSSWGSKLQRFAAEALAPLNAVREPLDVPMCPTIVPAFITIHQYTHFHVNSDSMWHLLSLSFEGQSPSQLWHNYYCSGSYISVHSDLV